MFTAALFIIANEWKTTGNVHQLMNGLKKCKHLDFSAKSSKSLRTQKQPIQTQKS